MTLINVEKFVERIQDCAGTDETKQKIADALCSMVKIEAEFYPVEAIPVEWLEDFRDGLDTLSESQLMRAIDLIIDAYRAEKKRKEDIRRCGMCKHFLGGGDFGTCCDQTYELKYRESNVCEKYSERKDK